MKTNVCNVREFQSNKVKDIKMNYKKKNNWQNIVASKMEMIHGLPLNLDEALGWKIQTQMD